jgi:hypothetical protein
MIQDVDALNRLKSLVFLRETILGAKKGIAILAALLSFMYQFCQTILVYKWPDSYRKGAKNRSSPKNFFFL